jgi:hypothetical protein
MILPIYTDTKVPNQPKSSADVCVIIKDLTDAETLLATLVGIIK